jgi:hypothetical protein
MKTVVTPAPPVDGTVKVVTCELSPKSETDAKVSILTEAAVEAGIIASVEPTLPSATALLTKARAQTETVKPPIAAKTTGKDKKRAAAPPNACAPAKKATKSKAKKNLEGMFGTDIFNN